MKRSSLPLAGSVGPCGVLRCGAFFSAHSLGLIAVIAVAASLLPKAFAATKASVKIGGEIARTCTISGLNGGGSSASASLALNDITKAGAKDLAFTLNCNTPFAYSLEAQIGALQHQTTPPASGENSSRIPYSVTVQIPTDAGAIHDTCGSESIRAGAVTCAFSDSGSGIALEATSNLRLAWTPEGVLAEGAYADSLKITVIPGA